MAKRLPPVDHDELLGYPPGEAERLAEFIYGAAPRPVQEVATIATLGLLAGICGNAYTVSGDGLNSYFTLVARSAIGKEQMSTGIGLLLDAVDPQDAMPLSGPGSPLLFARGYVHFGDFASGPALIRECAECPNKSFVAVVGEWGQRLREIGQAAAGNASSSNAATLKRAMLDLFGKSGRGGNTSGITYSKKEDKVLSVRGVAFSQIGETTPGTYWGALTNAIREDGFLSRFNVIEYKGPRPPLVPEELRLVRPPDDVVERLRELLVAAKTASDHKQRIKVETSSLALTSLNALNEECDDEINASEDEGVRQIWNRAHLKAWKVAALLAVCDNCVHPLISPEHAVWAIAMIKRDIACYTKRDAEGDLGNSDDSRERIVLAVLKEYLIGPALSLSYKVPRQMQVEGVVPRKYLHKRCRQHNSFATHRLGDAMALDHTLKSLCDSGYLAELDKVKAGESYTYQGRCFRIVQLP